MKVLKADWCATLFSLFPFPCSFLPRRPRALHAAPVLGDGAPGVCVRQLKRCFGPTLACFPATSHPSHAVYRAPLGGHACGTLMVCLQSDRMTNPRTYVFRPPLFYRVMHPALVGITDELNAQRPLKDRSRQSQYCPIRSLLNGAPSHTRQHRTTPEPTPGGAMRGVGMYLECREKTNCPGGREVYRRRDVYFWWSMRRGPSSAVGPFRGCRRTPYPVPFLSWLCPSTITVTVPVGTTVGTTVDVLRK